MNIVREIEGRVVGSRVFSEKAIIVSVFEKSARVFLFGCDDMDYPDRFGNSMLMDAIRKENKELYLALIECGADVNYLNEKTGLRPIHIAIQSGDVGLIHTIRASLGRFDGVIVEGSTDGEFYGMDLVAYAKKLDVNDQALAYVEVCIEAEKKSRDNF